MYGTQTDWASTQEDFGILMKKINLCEKYQELSASLFNIFACLFIFAYSTLSGGVYKLNCYKC